MPTALRRHVWPRESGMSTRRRRGTRPISFTPAALRSEPALSEVEGMTSRAHELIRIHIRGSSILRWRCAGMTRARNQLLTVPQSVRGSKARSRSRTGRCRSAGRSGSGGKGIGLSRWASGRQSRSLRLRNSRRHPLGFPRAVFRLRAPFAEAVSERWPGRRLRGVPVAAAFALARGRRGSAV